MKTNFTLGLRGRLIVLLVLVFVVIFAIALPHTITHRDEEINNATAHLLHNVKLIAARQQVLAARADAILNGLMLHPEMLLVNTTEVCQQFLAARIKLEKEFIQISKILPNGDITCSAVPGAGRVNIADRRYFQQALQSEDMVTSDMLISRIINQPSIIVAKAMRDNAGNVLAVFNLTLDLSWVQQDLAEAGLPQDTHLVLVDGSGKVVAHYPADIDWLGRSVTQTPFFQAITEHGEQGTIMMPGLDAGEPHMIAFTHLADTVSGPMILWLSSPMSVVTAPAQREFVLTLSILAALLFLLMTLVYWGGEQWLVKPLQKLAQALARLGAGDRTARTGLTYSNNEIGQLAQAFDTMVDSTQAAEARFHAVAEASLDALFILKSVRGEHDEILDFEFTDLNPRAEEMLSREREAVIGQKLCDLIPINRTDGFFEKYVAVVTTGTPLEEEFPIDAPQFNAKWLRHQVVRVGDGIAISSRDITSWKEAASEIRHQSRLRSMILKSVGEGIFGLDLQGNITFINSAGAEMLQSTEEEIIGKNAHALSHHSRADGTLYPVDDCPIYAAYKDGEIHRVDNEVFWRSDGTSFPVTYISTPAFNNEGGLAGAVVSFSDISVRKEREWELARTTRALKTLSQVNLLLVHANKESQLLQDVCRIIVEQGGYRMAWVGYVDDNPEKTITPKAWAGVEEGYLAQLNLTWADTERGQGPASRAIRSGEIQVDHDLTLPSLSPWRELVEKHGFASIYACPLSIEGRVIGALGIYSSEAEAFDKEELSLLKELGADLAFGIESLRTRQERDRISYAHAHHAEILQRSLEQSIQAIADTVEARDPYTAGHERRVAELAVAIAQELGLPENKIQGIRLAASVHDLGKIKVPAEILSKPGKLTDIEFMLIQTHPQAGYDILKDVDFPWPIADMVHQHHEKMDGSGYPQGLKGEQILLESRIMTVADVVEAMSSHRPYRAALGIDVALKEIERGRDSIYDEAAADACIKLFREKRFAFSGSN